MTGKTRGISPVPIHLSISSPNVVNLTLVDLPGLTKIAIDGQSDSIVSEIENMVRSYVSNPNTIILAVSPANQDLATSDAMKLAREMDPTGETLLFDSTPWSSSGSLCFSGTRCQPPALHVENGNSEACSPGSGSRLGKGCM